MLGEFAAARNRDAVPVRASPVPPEELAELLRRITDGTLSRKMAKDVFDEMWSRNRDVSVQLTGVEMKAPSGTVDAIIERRGLRQTSDAGAIETLVGQVIAANAAIVAEFRAGKEKAFNALVGQAMKASRGKADPGEVGAALRKKLA